VDSLKEIGERKIIELILSCLDPLPKMPIPFGDDVSAIDVGNDKLVVVNTDMLVGKTDVPPSMSMWQAARKASIMTISDLAAKGAQPAIILASLGLPTHLTGVDVLQIGKGLNAGAREYNAYVVGGDTNEAEDLIISCVALGFCQSQHLVKRDGAQFGDIVAVTGVLGKTSVGLKILLEELAALEYRDSFVDSVLMPKARVKEGVALAKTGAATSSIDVSDGLALSLHQLSWASNVGFRLTFLPVAPGVERFAELHGFDLSDLVLYGGEEYEILATVKPEFWEKAARAVEAAGGTLIKIGVVIDEKKVLLEMDGKTINVDVKGWQHFKTD
jgi:thiamine-monophosphate kinase